MITTAVLAVADTPAADLPAQVVTELKTLLGWAAGLVGLACLAKVLFVGARIAWDHHHTAGMESPPAAELLTALVAWLIAAVACSGIATALIHP